ncbi:MAG: hypothetical protein ABI775_05000 [Pseudonocardiales bacterium]
MPTQVITQFAFSATSTACRAALTARFSIFFACFAVTGSATSKRAIASADDALSCSWSVVAAFISSRALAPVSGRPCWGVGEQPRWIVTVGGEQNELTARASPAGALVTPGRARSAAVAISASRSVPSSTSAVA